MACLCVLHTVYVCMCTCVHVCMCTCVHVCMCACVHVCMCACVHTAILHDSFKGNAAQPLLIENNVNHSLLVCQSPKADPFVPLLITV